MHHSAQPTPHNTDPHNFTGAAPTSGAAVSRDAYGRVELHEPRSRKSQFSNVIVASILAVPLAMLGVWLGSSWDRQLAAMGRPYGLWYPPVNPYLREDHRELGMAKRRAAREAAAAASHNG